VKGEYFPLRGSQSYAPRPGGMTAGEESSLRASGHLFEAPDSTLRLCTGAYRHWPEGRGVFTDVERTVSVWVNEQEHLRFSACHQGDALQLAFRQLVRVMDSVAGELRRQRGTEQQVYAHSNQLGYLTSSLANLGTAMQVSVVAKLPCLSRRQGDAQGSSSWQAWCARQQVQVHPFYDATGRQVPDAFELSNCGRLGISEVSILNNMIEVISRVVQMEMRMEACHPIEDLLASNVEQPAVACGNTVLSVPAETPEVEAAQKACSTLLTGLMTGRFLDAIIAGGRCAGATDERVSAELVFDSIFRTCASDREKACSQQAEEVRSAATAADSRPISVASCGGTLSTVKASSDVSWNDVSTELVGDLVDAQVNCMSFEEVSGAQKAQATPEVNLQDVKEKARFSLAAALIKPLQDAKDVVKSCVRNSLRCLDLPMALVPPVPAEAAVSLSEVKEKARQCFRVAMLSDALKQEEKVVATMPPPAPVAAPVSREIAPDLSGLRDRLHDTLLDVVTEGKLEEVLQVAFQGGKAAADPPLPMPPSKELVEAQATAPPQQAQAGEVVVAQSLQDDAHATFIALKVLSHRDRRIGELFAMIRQTEQSIVDREKKRLELQESIASAKLELSHMELDIEWHRRARQGAEERSTELEIQQRRLHGDLEFHNQKLRQCAPHCLETDVGGPSIYSSRSELSTATGCTMSAGMGTSVASYGNTPRALPPLNLDSSSPQRR